MLEKSKIRKYHFNQRFLLKYSLTYVSRFQRQFQYCRLYISATAHVKLIHCSIFCFRILCLHIEPNTYGEDIPFIIKKLHTTATKQSSTISFGMRVIKKHISLGCVILP